MTTTDLREQLHQQIDSLPDEVVEQIADFTVFVMVRRHIIPLYTDWNENEWQAFALEQFVREDDEVEYTLDDAEEVYHR
jgi:hypothetical protein